MRGVVVDFTARHPLSDAAFRAGWGTAPSRGMMAPWAKKEEPMPLVYLPHQAARKSCRHCGQNHTASQHSSHAFTGRIKQVGTLKGLKLSPAISAALARAEAIPMPRAAKGAKPAKAKAAKATKGAKPCGTCATPPAAKPRTKRAAQVLNPDGQNWQTVPTMGRPSQGRRIAVPQCISGPGGAIYCQVPQAAPAPHVMVAQPRRAARAAPHRQTVCAPRRPEVIVVNEMRPAARPRKAATARGTGRGGNATHKAGCGCPFCVRERKPARASTRLRIE